MLLGAAFVQPYSAASPSQGSSPPQPATNAIRVSTEDELQNAVHSIVSNTTILITPGIYELSSTLEINGVDDVTLQGATDNRDDVVLVGKGMANASYENVPSGVTIRGRRVTIANLTIRDVFQHALVFESGAQAPHVFNVHLLDTGGQLVATGAEEGRQGVDAGIVERSVFEYTAAPPTADGGGLDVRNGAGWTVRNNTFAGIAGAGGAAAPAVLFHDGSRDAVVSGNTFINCQREIWMGARESTAGDNIGGMVRNNFIARRAGAQGDAAIVLASSPGTEVLHNTILIRGTAENPIESRFRATKAAIIANNLLDGPVASRDGATPSVFSNYLGATASMFRDAARGDLHLVATATAVIDHAPVLEDARDDWDGDRRPQGNRADFGADEWTSSAATGADLSRDAALDVGFTTPAATANTTLAAAAAVATLPSPWSSADVGSPSLAGSSTLSGSTLTVAGAGADIWNTSDQFQFAYQPMTGDGEIVARVVSLTNTNSWAKAGVMIRNTLAADSVHAFVALTPSSGVAFQRRRSTGGTTRHIAGSSGQAPDWVKLVRVGSQFTAYSSADGATWQTIGSTTVNMDTTVFAGLAVTSHDASALATATFTDIFMPSAAVLAKVVFTPSTDDSVVTSYRVDVFTAGADPSTAPPLASQDLGKPPVVSGQMSADISPLYIVLPGGIDVATVTAIGSAGSTRSAPSPTFAR